ncbi:MAG: matrixin family metalloprotease [Akkermansiaceae bacterium]
MRLVLLLALTCLPLKGIVIKVDYRYDTQDFFENPAAKAVVEAAAARWGRIVNQALLPVNMQDETFVDGRFQIIHPGTGESHVVSAAASRASDFYVEAGLQSADEYLNGFFLGEDVWVLYVGARILDEAARGAPISGGGNLTSVYSDPDSFVNRGFNVGRDSLPVIGGAITFDLDRNWSFNLSQTNNGGALDFYSVALHEIGHGLGLNSRSVAEFQDLLSGNRFVGENTVRALEADTGENVTGLEIVSSSARDYHWVNGRYRSKIFPFGTPMFFGTVGGNNLQSLLMEAVFVVGGEASRREVTNIEVAALKDIGWSVISENPPRVPELPIKIGASENGGLSIQLMSEVGATYTVQTSPDGCSWVNVIPSFEGNGGPLSWSDGQEGTFDPFGPASGLTGKYYRVIKD